MIKYRVCLTQEERAELEAMVSKGKRKATAIRKAHVLLASDENAERRSERAISEAYHLSVKSVERIRRSFCESGMDIFTAPPRKTRSDKLIDGTVEAYILAVSCSEPPLGQSRWKLQSIADRVVELGVVEHLSHTSVATVLKKMKSSLGG
ncbi:MAG: helix-turn-helix domain-containing protein [Flavisolibacter sp.]|nr:helix-turn-helix domain-containing protein [Flavisolibacter sp.]